MNRSAVAPPPAANEKGLGYKHQQAVEALKRRHQDGSPCDWCGPPHRRLPSSPLSARSATAPQGESDPSDGPD